MKLRITKKDIAEGFPNIASSCPIALAVKRKFPHYGVRVWHGKNSGGIDIWPDENYPGRNVKRAKLPKDGCSFARSFDARNPVTPLTLEVDL